MNLPSILDVVIGLIIVYLVFSLLSSQIQELIATILQWRARNLEQSIIILLGGSDQNSNPDLTNDKNTNLNQTNYYKAKEITESLYNNPLIASINQSELPITKRRREYGPSYIPDETFATALIETLKVKFPSLKNQQLQIDDLVAEIDSSDYLPTNLRHNLVALARRAQRKFTNKEMQILQFQKEIETWFNRSMDRASGVYKRNAQGIALMLGIFISTVANVDTLNLINKLSKETVLRNAISQNSSRIENCQNANNNQLDCVGQQVSATLQRQDSIPIGWANKENRVTSFYYLDKIFGFIISGVAISMGAPFWFEALNKIVNVRNTGPKPQSDPKQ